MTETIVSIDGALVPPEGAVISVFDRGLLYGDGLFEILRTWEGVAVELDAHLARLRASAAALALAVPAELRAWIERTLAAAPGERRVRVIVTRGPGGIRERLADLRAGRAIVIAEPLTAAATATASIGLVTLDHPSRGPGAVHKTLAYLPNLLAREAALAVGADDAVLISAAGDVTECATANLFAVSENLVVTPPTEAGALPGIARARVLDLCGRLGIPAAVRRLPLAELRAADEVFVTSSVRGVVPVTTLDGVPRRGGPLTARLAAAYREEMSALAGAIRDRGLL